MSNFTLPLSIAISQCDRYDLNDLKRSVSEGHALYNYRNNYIVYLGYHKGTHIIKIIPTIFVKSPKIGTSILKLLN